MKTMNTNLARVEKMTVETTAFSSKEVKDARLARYIASVADAVDMARVISASSILHLTLKDVAIMYALQDMKNESIADFFKLQRDTQKIVMAKNATVLENGSKIYKRASLVTTADVLRAIMILNAFDSRYHIILAKDGSTKVLIDESRKSLLRSSFYLTGDADANGKKVRRTVAFNDSFRQLFIESLRACQGKSDWFSLNLNTALTALDIEKMEAIASVDKKKAAEKVARTQEARADKKAEATA